MYRTSELLTLMWVCPLSCLKTFFIFKSDYNFITTPINKQSPEFPMLIGGKKEKRAF